MNDNLNKPSTNSENLKPAYMMQEDPHWVYSYWKIIVLYDETWTYNLTNWWEAPSSKTLLEDWDKIPFEDLDGKIQKKIIEVKETHLWKNYTKDQIAGRTPVKTVNGVKYYLNGDGQIAKDPKGQGSAKPEDKNWKGKRLDPKTTKTLPGGKYPTYWTSKDRMTWEREYGEEANGSEVQKKACGSKLKKHFNGGSLNLSLLEKKF